MTKQVQTRIVNEYDKKYIRFYKAYKFLFQDDNYQALPYQSKAMYIYMANKLIRVLHSQQKADYIDQDGQPFITYSLQDLEKDLKLSNSSVKKYKRILVEYGLITTQHRGKIIYVKKPQLSDSTLTYNDGKKLSYFHMPQFFDTNPNYQNASLLTRLVYTLQKERFALSLANVSPGKPSNYTDENGRVFCIYANETLARMLNVCEQKIIRAKKELEALGLLKQRKQSINKPNLLYLYTPLASEQMEAEALLEHRPSETSKNKFALVPPEKSIRSCFYKRVEVNNEVTYGLNMQSSNTVFSNTAYSNTSNAMYTMYDIENVDQSHLATAHTDDDIQNTQKEMKLHPFNFSAPMHSYLKNFSVEDLKIVLKKLVTAKNHYNQNYDTHFTLEEIDESLLDMLKRVKLVMAKKQSTVTEMGGYIYRSAINEFKAHEIEQIESVQSCHDETEEAFHARWCEKAKQAACYTAHKYDLRMPNSQKETDMHTYIAELDELGVW